MFRCTTAFAFALLCAMVIAYSAHPMSNHCVSLKETRFEMCMSAGYDKTFPFENDFTEAEQQEVAREFTEILKSMKNCSHDGLAELIECSLFVPKCNMLGEPVYPCRQACAEYLRRCEYELSKHALDYLIPWCLLLSNGSVGHAPCFQPSNFTANESAPGPLDRGCQELIFPACKNIGAFDHTLISVSMQKKLYSWFFKKEYNANSTETEFPGAVRKLLDQYPKCQENIKKLFCGEHFPPCFLDESPRVYSLCQPLCDQIATDCPGFFSQDLIASEYCSSKARAHSIHGYCHTTEWPASFEWFHHEATTKSPSLITESHQGTQAWKIFIAVFIPVLVVGLVVAVAIWMKKRTHRSLVAYIKHYEKDADDTFPLET